MDKTNITLSNFNDTLKEFVLVELLRCHFCDRVNGSNANEWQSVIIDRYFYTDMDDKVNSVFMCDQCFEALPSEKRNNAKIEPSIY